VCERTWRGDCWLSTMVAPDKVSVDAAVSSILLELERISSMKEEQRTTLKAFLHGKDGEDSHFWSASD